MKHATLQSVLLVVGASFVALPSSCLKKSKLFCDEDTPCTDPALPFCDLEGDFPASEGIGRTCIPNPFPDAGAPDGGGSSDAAPTVQPFVNGQFADLVLGQPNFMTANDLPQSQGSLRNPLSVASDGSRLWVGESNGRNRIVQWNSLPTVNGQQPDLVIGQADFSSSEVATTASRFSPSHISASGNRLLVSSGSRALLFSPIPVADDPTAALVLGQTDFTSTVESSAAGGLARGSDGVWTDGTRVAVADRFNNRVLLWNAFPTSNGQPADTVLGQADFGMAGAPSPPTRSSMNSPYDVLFDGQRLFVADFFNSRVLIWDGWPTSNGAPADVVVGQPDGVSGDFNQGGAAGASTLNRPSSLATFNGALLVADQVNRRVLAYKPIPSTDGASATAVLGQDNFTAVDDPGGPTSNQFGLGDITVANTFLFVPDFFNRRVLRFTLRD